MTSSDFTTTPTFAPIPRRVLGYAEASVYLGMDTTDRSEESIKRALDRLVDRKQLQATVIFGRRVFRIKDLDICLDRAAVGVT